MENKNKIWLPPLAPRDKKWTKIYKKFQGQARTDWMGFSGKTLWDWLSLLGVFLIPIVIAAATIWFSAQQSEISSQTSERQYQTDLQVAKDQQQENALQTYLGRISDLLLNSKLRESKSGDEVRIIARALTLITLSQLNGVRKGKIVRFLKDAGLIEIQNSNDPNLSHTYDIQGIATDSPVISLTYADLSNADLSKSNFNGAIMTHTNLSHTLLLDIDLSYAELGGANLFGADLTRAELNGCHLNNTNLSLAGLTGANLFEADLSNANLTNADLEYADLTNTALNGANMTTANMINVNLSAAGLHNTNLTGANMIGANLEYASLSSANLRYAFLKNAKVTMKQL